MNTRLAFIKRNQFFTGKVFAPTFCWIFRKRLLWPYSALCLKCCWKSTRKIYFVRKRKKDLNKWSTCKMKSDHAAFIPCSWWISCCYMITTVLHTPCLGRQLCHVAPAAQFEWLCGRRTDPHCRQISSHVLHPQSTSFLISSLKPFVPLLDKIRKISNDNVK